MSIEPLNKGSNKGKVPFDQNFNIIHCCLSINSTTIYTYDNCNFNNKVNVNYVEIIANKLGEINEIQESRMDHLSLNETLNFHGQTINLMIYYKKVLINSDLITIIIMSSDKLMDSFIHNLLDKLMNEYITGYHNINETFEFKLRMKEIINSEEDQLVKLYENYGSINDDLHQVKNLMNENIDKILERGENLDVLINKTTTLNTNSNSFRRRTVLVKRKMMWSNFKFLFLLSIILSISLYLLIGAECGLPFYKKCLHPNKPKQPTN